MSDGPEDEREMQTESVRRSTERGRIIAAQVLKDLPALIAQRHDYRAHAFSEVDSEARGTPCE